MTTPKTAFNPYETVRSGYFGAHTAAVDWCEPNHEYSQHVAELWNTISSVLPWALVSLVQIRHVFRQQLPLRTVLGPVGILAVSLGSAFFHGTLTMAGQAADELPMLWFVGIQFVVVQDTRPRNVPATFKDWLFPLAIACLNVVTFYYYIKLGEDFFPYFCVAFAFQLIGATIRGVALSQSDRVKTRRQMQLSYLATLGVTLFASAFALWVVETQYCREILHIRATLPTGAAFFLSLHAFWHILAFYASTILATGAQYLNLSLTEPDQEYGIAWRYLGLIPFLVRQKRQKKK